MKNWYWNRDNFESLVWLADRLCEVPELVRLADYCRLREKGLRKQALAALRKFLTEAALLAEEKRLALSLHLLELRHAAPGAHQFLAQPLIDELILPSLRQAAQPGNEAFRQLALFLGEQDDLRTALRHDPADERVRKRLADLLLGYADYAMHHLDESCFIGSEEYCRSVLDEAANLLDPKIADPEVFHYLIADHAELSAMFTDWREYKAQDQAVPFPEWCAGRGRDYGWSQKFYYGA